MKSGTGRRSTAIFPEFTLYYEEFREATIGS
jgi:hypothetical protein